MKKIKVAIFVLVGVFLMTQVSVWAQQAKQAPIKVGGIFPLTGYLSWLGEYKRKAGELQTDIINKAGGINGHPLELIIYDDQSSPEQAAKVTQRLIAKDEVVAIAGTASLPISAAVASITNKFKIPTLVSSGYAIDYNKDLFIFNTAHKTDFAVATAFQYFQKKGIQQVALLMPIGPLGELGSSVARQQGPQYGITIIGEEKFDIKSPDVTAQLAKLRTLNPKAIFSFSTGEPAALIARNMAQIKMDVPLVVSHGNANPGFLKLVSGIPGTILVPSGKIMAPNSLSDSDPCKKVIMEFNRKHLERYNEPANYYSAELGDAIALVEQGLRVVGSANPQKLRDAIEKTKNFPGMQGIYHFSPADHYGTRASDMILLTVKTGKWEVAK